MLIYLDHIDSTNRLAKELALDGKPSGTVVCAERQTSGRGQHGRNFVSPKGGLYFSLLLMPDISPERLPLVTLATGLACRACLCERFSLQAHIKWPNDLYVHGRKIAGILCERVLPNNSGSPRPMVIIGVGLNVNSALADFPEELQPLVTSVYEQASIRTDLKMLLPAVVEKIIATIHRLQSDSAVLLAQWQEYDYLLNKPVVYTNGPVTLHGIGLGLTPQGLYRFVDTEGNDHCIVGGQLRPGEGGKQPAETMPAALPDSI